LIAWILGFDNPAGHHHHIVYQQHQDKKKPTGIIPCGLRLVNNLLA
jgi:hypothetical protein